MENAQRLLNRPNKKVIMPHASQNSQLKYETEE